jgi:hypothetical protein
VQMQSRRIRMVPTVCAFPVSKLFVAFDKEKNYDCGYLACGNDHLLDVM